MFVGTDDYVVIENRGSCPVDLSAIRFSASSSQGPTYDIDADLDAVELAPGARVAITDSAEKPGDIVLTRNIFFTEVTSDFAMLCEGPCSAATVIDVVAHGTPGEDLPPLPDGVDFTPSPLSGIAIANGETDAFLRTSYAGAAPTFAAADWIVGPASR